MTKSKAAFLFGSQSLGKQRLYLWTFTFKEFLGVKEARKRWNHLFDAFASNLDLTCCPKKHYKHHQVRELRQERGEPR